MHATKNGGIFGPLEPVCPAGLSRAIRYAGVTAHVRLGARPSVIHKEILLSTV
jgi:hypothetical protein